jgi:phosphoribosylamine---glycine ligase
MKVLVIGSGGREHALAHRLAGEDDVDAVVCAPGNPGTARLGENLAVDPANPHALFDLASAIRADLTIVGPELPLSAGVVDAFSERHARIVGPTAAAARLETSKAFAKAFMTRHRVPTARYKVFDAAAAATAAVRNDEFGFPVVIKADGLAAGKGVVIADDAQAAESAIAAMMRDRRFGVAGARVVVEQCLEGAEASFFVLSDGTRATFIGSAQDHKRIFDGDRGPNTGGMGAFAPSPLVDARLEAQIMREIVEPTIGGMRDEGHPYRGFLYVGLMLTTEGPKVIEFNVRLGDPEAEVILPLIDEPLVPLLERAADGAMHAERCRIAPSKSVAVVLASKGYPESSDAGRRIDGIDDAERVDGVTVYHAGTALRGGELVTAGGRVLTISASGPTYANAIERAYAAVDRISFEGMQYRRDIGRKALNHQITKSANHQIQ